MNRQKTGIAIGVCAAMLIAALSVGNAGAGHVENQWFVDLGGPGGFMKFNDVAWSGDGSVALFVGVNSSSGSGEAWWFYAENSSWAKATGTVSTVELLSVKWAPQSVNGAKFLVMGRAMSGGYWYTAYPGNQTIAQHADLTNLMNYDGYDICYNPYVGPAGTMVVIGQRGSGSPGAAALQCQLNSWIWSIITNCFNTSSANNAWFGVALAPMPSNDLCIVGQNIVTRQSLYLRYNYTGTTKTDFMTTMALTFTDIAYDSVNDQMLLSTAMRNLGEAAVYAAKGPSYNTTSTVSSNAWWQENIWGLDVKGGKIIAVGQNSSATRGVVYDIWTVGSNTYMGLQSNATGPAFTGRNFTAVTIRPMGIPFGLVSGSAFKYSFLNSDSNIVVNTIYPHINFIDMYAKNINGTSVLNGMNNVDPGDSSMWYRLNISGYYNTSAGGADAIDRADVFMWYDNGLTGVDNAGLVDSGFANLGIHLRWVKGVGFTMVFPGTGESAIQTIDCSASMDAGGLPFYNISFAFRPNQQVRNASGDGAWSAGIGPLPGRYWIDDGVEDQGSTIALNDAFTWDVKVEVQNTTSSSAATAYDEFGVNRYVYLGTGAALPGSGSLAGSGAPGAMVILQPSTFQNVTFSANCIYDLKVWAVTDLLASVPANGVIPALNLSVGGGQWGAYQPLNGTGEANSVWLIGGSSTLVYGNPGSTGVTNNTYNAPSGGNAVVWRCSIPLGKAEDSYSGTLTYAIAPEA